MTEHSASVFVFFFLGEYSSLVLMSSLMTVFFFGGYLSFDVLSIIPLNVNGNSIYSLERFGTINSLHNSFINNEFTNLTWLAHIDFLDNSYNKAIYSWVLFLDKFEDSFTFGFKVIIVVFLFIWVRASFPRLRYDQLMALCWKALLPLVFSYIIFTITLLFVFDMFPVTFSLPG